MKKKGMRKNWINQDEPSRFFDAIDNFVEPRPLPGQVPTDVLRPKGK